MEKEQAVKLVGDILEKHAKQAVVEIAMQVVVVYIEELIKKSPNAIDDVVLQSLKPKIVELLDKLNK